MVLLKLLGETSGHENVFYCFLTLGLISSIRGSGNDPSVSLVVKTSTQPYFKRVITGIVIFSAQLNLPGLMCTLSTKL